METSFVVGYYGKDFTLKRDMETLEQAEALLEGNGIKNGIMDLLRNREGDSKECVDITGRLKVSNCRSFNCAMLNQDTYPEDKTFVLDPHIELHATCDILYCLSGKDDQ